MKKKILGVIAYIFIMCGIANAAPYGTLIPGSAGNATLGIPNSTSCTDTDEGHICSDTDDNTLRVGPDVYYPGPDTGPSPDCNGTGVYQDGEGNCDDTTDFVITCTTGQTLGTDCGSGYDFTIGFVVEIASGTVILPAVAAGYHGCFKATTAAAITIDPNAIDSIVLDGVDGGAGKYIVSPGNIDDTICLYRSAANTWKSMFNPKSFTAEP